MVQALVRRARLRFAMNEALGQFALAFAFVLAGLTLVLIAGTRYLEWWVLVPIAAGGLAFGAWRVWRLTPGEYAAAILVDRNAGLHDALSTAWHFASRDSCFGAAQRLQAENAAESIDLRQTVPFTMPRSLFAMAAASLLTSAVFAVRFYSVNGMDLRAPLTEVWFEDAAASAHAKPRPPEPDLTQRRRLETAESLLAKLGVPLRPDDEAPPDALDRAIDKALETPGRAGAKSEKDEGGRQGNALDQTPAGDPLEDKEQPGSNAKSAGEKAGSKNGGDSSSLLSKLKDAVSDLLSKAGQTDAGQKNQAQKSGGGKSEKGAAQKSAQKGQEQRQNQAGSEEGEPNGDAQQGQQADGKAGAKGTQQSSQAGNGVGSQDGAKELQAAEQLKAMGKISEIIGKRAATLSGETTIEVQSGKQQLRTEYSKKAAAHVESDGGTGRDEIPLELQDYVQRYFEQVRKVAPKAK